MKKFLIFSMAAFLCLAVTACADHDDPQLAPIDTTQVQITASVKDYPNSEWMTATEEMTVSVSDLKMISPKGVYLRSISLVANNGTSSFVIDEKPYSGSPLEFKVPLIGLQGRINLSLRGKLIKKNSRDAEIIIADNIQRIVFSETPEFECEGWLYVSVKSTSTSGEEYNKSFEVKSIDHFTIPVPQSELYWQPSDGKASTLEVTLGGGGLAWSPNTTFDCAIAKTSIGHSSGEQPTLKLTIPNTPGSLKSQNLQLYVLTSYYGTWENVTIKPFNVTNVFSITESE